MAQLKKKRSQNIEGNFYVDSDCINCGACYWIAPETFKETSGLSAVYAQPSDQDEGDAYRALLSCPVNSIGVQADSKVAQATRELPYELADGVYHCGFHAESSYGAASFFVTRKSGNILFDSPRYVKQLENKFNKLGGVPFQLLSHKDDIADTNKYWEKFQGKRHLHRDDMTSKTKDYEVLFEGNDIVEIDEDITMIPVPGHTKGSVCYLYKNKYLFTGDHLAYSKDLGHLYAFRNACWYDFDEQIVSMERLLDFDFEYVLPGHGRPFQATKSEMKSSLEKCIAWMKN